MGYVRLGRKLGVGVRVASWMLRERANQSARKAGRQPTQTVLRERPAQVARNLRASVGARQGAKRLGERFWGPFAYAGGVVWLEVTGCFFVFFGLFFLQEVWKLHASWRSGPEHEKLLISIVAAVVFFYFGASSFYRARKKERQYRAKHG